MSLVWSIEGLNKTKWFNKRDSFCLTAKLGHDFFFPLDLNRNISFSFILRLLGMAGMVTSVLPVLILLCLDWNYTTDSAWALASNLPTEGMGLVSLFNSMNQFLIINLSLFCSPLIHTYTYIIYTCTSYTHNLYISYINFLYKLLIYIYMYVYVQMG